MNFQVGGDIYIENEVEEPLVFQSVQVADDVDETRVAETAKNLSPTSAGTQKSCT